jgi:hypothetical protein
MRQLCCYLAARQADATVRTCEKGDSPSPWFAAVARYGLRPSADERSRGADGTRAHRRAQRNVDHRSPLRQLRRPVLRLRTRCGRPWSGASTAPARPRLFPCRRRVRRPWAYRSGSVPGPGTGGVPAYAHHVPRERTGRSRCRREPGRALDRSTDLHPRAVEDGQGPGLRGWGCDPVQELLRQFGRARGPWEAEGLCYGLRPTR